jgi:soluble cytochrome b562
MNDVYSRHNITATNIDSNFEEWKKGNVNASDMMNEISHDRTEIQKMRKELTDARPAQEWQESFDTYVKALDSFAKYLSTMETKIQSGNKADSQELDGLRKEMQDYLNSSISAMPFGK